MKIVRLFVYALAFLALLPVARLAQADEGSGTPFFLLSDASYGPEDNPMVRLEAQNLGAVSEYGGVDVYVYRVRQPIDFLKAQKNLHRVNTRGDFAGPGMSNALARIWDNWWMESRDAWRKVFSDNARQAVAAQAPEVRTHPLVKEATPVTMNPQYRPLKQHALVDSFRYPVHAAKPIEPPAGVTLAGSSSEFIQVSQGNVMIPLGKKEPGLYLVEAMVGDHRAATLVFVSSSIAVTKVSSKQMLVWVADRRNGTPVENANTVWSDGVGVLGSARTDKRGVATFQRNAPEKTYVFGEDAKGGVYVAENFYYDSEIYNTKMYAVTDRPLYRPGETVFVKFLGRNFRSARESSAIEAGDLKLQVFDAAGFPVAGQTLRVTPQTGADTSFQLPDNAVAGGYEMRFTYKGDAYGAAFRVAEYQKPHFEINVLPEKKDFRTNEEVKGRLQLVYPDGKPVRNAKLDLTVRAQRITMIEGDLGYAGQFPVQLKTETLSTDDKGNAEFALPAAKEPSRYVLSVLATDGAAYRVRMTKEILIERSAGTYSVKADRTFSAPKESVEFSLQALPDAAASSKPASWEWIRLESRKRSSGTLAEGAAFSIAFAEPGTYTVSVRDAAGNIVGATSHYVSGNGMSAPQGSIEMVFDKSSYKPGDIAIALVTFPKTVDQALLTLERDSVEKASLLGNASGWVRAKRIAPKQWRIELPVKDDYGPNITLSVVYVKDGEYVFQNLGLRVEQPRIAVDVRPDKAVYAPGETVTLDLAAAVTGKPVAGAQLTVGVVDEMVYVLQPEIAPDIFDFFYHPRRNNVRTTASLSFIAYDLAKPPSGAAKPSRRQTHERAIKLLERPRREDKDTALWQPSVTTDAAGRARVTFKMPDSLTRWRITVRAADASGTVGQNIAYVRSDKDFYVKWTSPDWMRSQDAPVASVAVFNQGNQEALADLTAAGALPKGRDTMRLRLKPGANFVAMPLSAGANVPRVDLGLAVNGRTVDALTVPLKVVPVHWQSRRSLAAPVKGADTPVRLPIDADNVRLQFADGAAAQFRRIIDDLTDYPYGCVEQTSSRLIPYSLALQAVLPTEDALAAQLTQRLHSYRFRLAQMAGPEATFGWWTPPDRDADALLTAYAYYADWHASRALKLSLPDSHFDRLIEVYRKNGVRRSHWHRALMLYWMQEMGLPVRSLAEALADEVAAAPGMVTKTGKDSPLASAVLTADEGDLHAVMTRLLSAYVVQQAQGTVPPRLAAMLDTAAVRVRQAGLPMGEALLLLTSRMPAAEAASVLERVRSEGPTIDRSLALLWTYRALGGKETVLRSAIPKVVPDTGWQPVTTATGQQVYRWNAKGAPTSVKLAAAPATGLTAVVQYDSREPETTSLPVKLERRLYRLKRVNVQRSENGEPGDADRATFALELLPPDAPMKTDEVYLDEVVLKRVPGTSNAPLRFGIVEVPLPPGTSADRTTWGISLQWAGRSAEALEKARYEQTPRGYAVPVETLDRDVTIRHLVRAAQAGTFAMPPARYYRMYQPEQKAFEEKPRARLEIR